MKAAAKSPPTLAVDTLGRRIHVEWDPQAPVTPLGQLVFFAQFLAAGGLYAQWVADWPLRYRSPNAPRRADVLGTGVLATLSGAWRYAHVTALRGDRVNPQGLGMEKVVSEDSLRRAFVGQDAAALAHWQTTALRRTYALALAVPGIADLEVTVKPIYGHQAGAALGYNPHKPGRPSHAYHTIFLRSLRVALDVEVRSGKEHACLHGRTNLWRVWEALPAAQRPWLVCGDAHYGNEQLMAECEARGQAYLFRQRSTKGVKQLILLLERQGGWQPLAEGWSGAEGTLQLTGWTRRRRTVVLRRKRSATPAAALPLLAAHDVEVEREPIYEYVVLVTSLAENLLTLAQLYRQRADVENAYDELKNQWGWGGFTTGDLLRCQLAARRVALVYNWWNLCVRCAQPERAREAVTSRPAAARGRTNHPERWPNHAAPDQQPRRGQSGAKLVDGAEFVFKRTDECCGAVARRRTLAADLAPHFRTLPLVPTSAVGTQRLKLEKRNENQTKRSPNAKFIKAQRRSFISQLPFLG